MTNRLMEKIKNSPFTYATVFTSILFVVFMCTEPALSGAGDRNISEYLMSGGRIAVGNFFINPVLAKVLRICNSIILANWWSVFSVAVTFSGIYVFLWFLNKKLQKQHWLVKVLTSLMFILFMWQLMLRHAVNFTHTATICGLAGFCVIADAAVSDDTRKKCVVKFLIGAAFMMLAGQIRSSALKIVVAFSIMSFAYILVFPFSLKNIVRDVTTSIKEKKRVWIAMLSVIFVMIGTIGTEKLYPIIFPEYNEYSIACGSRAAICDYSDRYLSYEENADLYTELGISEAWYDMAMGFVTSDMNFFSTEYKNRMIALQLPSQSKFVNVAEVYLFCYDIAGLEEDEQEIVRSLLKNYSIIEIAENMEMLVPVELQESIISLRDCFINQVILYGIFLLFVILIIVLQGWQNTILPFLGSLAGFAACNIYLLLGGRFPWRVIASCILCSVIAYVVMSTHLITEHCISHATKGKKAVLMSLVFVTIMLGTMLVTTQKDEFTVPEAKVSNQYCADILEYMDSNSNNVYLYTDGSGMRFMRAYNMWSTHEPNYLDNTFPLTAEFILGCDNALAMYGITDVYNNMLDYPNIRVCYSEECTSYFYRYLRDYYDPCVTMARVEAYEGKGFYRYSRQVLPSEKQKVKLQTYFKETTRYKNDENVDASYIIRCKLDEEVLNTYFDYFINVTDKETGNVYSYGMTRDGERVKTEILCMAETWNPENIQMELVAKRADGVIVTLSDLTKRYLNKILDEK